MTYVAASARALQVRRVFLFRFGKIQAMEIRGIEEVALNAPYFVIHLIPFGARVDVDFHAVEFQLALARLGSGTGCGDEPLAAFALRPLAVEGLFAVGR